MASIRQRRLADGSDRFDVAFSDNGRATSVTFTDRDEAEGFAHCRRLRQRRWPLQPLLELAGYTTRAFAARHRLPWETVRKAAQGRGVNDVQVDEWAIAAGFHPVEVWGWDWITAAHPTTTDVGRLAGEAVA